MLASVSKLYISSYLKILSDYFSNMLSINYPRQTFYYKNVFPRNFSMIFKTDQESAIPKQRNGQ